MPIIDIHHHWINEPGYLEHLLREMDRRDVERVGLMALGQPFRRLFLTTPDPDGCAGNQELAHVLAEPPQRDRFFGYGFFQLGDDPPELIDWFAEAGFLGVKFHIPRWDYDDERCFPAYERANRHRLICLFHMGPFILPEPLVGQRVSSSRCRPIMLDPVANEFPELRMIIAHLGVCWAEEAATLCRIYPNVYADLSGNLNGWRVSKPIAWFKEMLYWSGASEKVFFGSDLHYRDLDASIRQQTSILEQMGWNRAQVRHFLYENAARVFGFPPPR